MVDHWSKAISGCGTLTHKISNFTHRFMTKQRRTKNATRQMQSISVPLDQGNEVLYLLNFQDDE